MVIVAAGRPVSRPVHPIAYRADIDGLRAVAVLAVIAFHAAPRVVPGGFVGVDVFFVISGYLISGIIFKELEQDAFSFAAFYARRIRRIFPALILVLTAVAAFGWYVMIGDEFTQLKAQLAGGALFTANILVWRSAGYFDERAALKPLLHLWSLAIEEQFYAVWPPLLYFCWKRRGHVLAVILAVIAASFWQNISLTRTNEVAAFYLPTTRMWELLLGALLAYAERFRRERVPSRASDAGRFAANARAWAGFVCILLAVDVLGKGPFHPGWWSHREGLRDLLNGAGLDPSVYPGWPAVVPTAGAVLLIRAGKDAWLNRVVLSYRPVVYVGLLSYPLYLWHWPLLSFLEITESGHPSGTIKLAAVALAFLLAWMTYRFVEQPIRRTTSVRTPVRIAALAFSIALDGGVSLYLYKTGALAARTPVFPTQLAAPIPSPRHDRACSARFPTQGEYCQQYGSDAPVTTALVGDSHAEHFLRGVGAYLETKGENVVHLGESGCPPLPDVRRLQQNRPDTCHLAMPSVINYVGNAPAITRVILSFRGVLDVTGTGYGEDRLAEIPYGIAGTTLSAPDAIGQSLERTVSYFLGRNKTVWLILQVPEMSFNLGDCTGRPFSFEKRPPMSPCAEPRSAVVARQEPYRRIVREVARRLPALHVFDPMPVLCDQQWCYAGRNKKLFYVDDHHLSADGSLLFADKFTF